MSEEPTPLPGTPIVDARKLWVGTAVLIRDVDGKELPALVKDIAIEGITISELAGGVMYFLPWHRVSRISQKS